jgi:hypothetical protein
MVGMTSEERREMAAIKSLAERALADLATHTAVCAQRQGDLTHKVDTVIKILFWVFSTLLVSMTGTLVNLIIHFPPKP